MTTPIDEVHRLFDDLLAKLSDDIEFAVVINHPDKELPGSTDNCHCDGCFASLLLGAMVGRLGPLGLIHMVQQVNERIEEENRDKRRPH